MYGKGFRFLSKVIDLEYPEVVEEVKTSDVRDKYADILDMIFAVDPTTGFPSSILGCYLSENVSEEIRHFIDTKLLREVGEESSIPQNIFNEYQKLDSDFLVNVSPSQYESVEEYEVRLHRYFQELESQEDFKKNVAELKKRLKIE